MLQVGQVDECGRLELKEGAGHRVRAVCAALRHGRGRRGRAERSGAPLLALGRYGRSNGLMQMALSQRCWSWLAAISGGKPLVMDSTSTLGGYLIIGAGCSGSWDQWDIFFQNR